MRVIECNFCEHPEAPVEEEQVRGMVERDAYTATDA
jgi:hypothetical protein